MGLSLLALAAWCAAAARALGLRRRDRGLPWDAERVGLATLAAVVLVFGVHSTIDWTWFVPANAACALLCAAWVAGRGPLRARLEGASDEGASRHLTPVSIGTAALVLVIALVTAWWSYQPVRSEHASDAAFDRLDRGNPAGAVAVARVAVDRNPLSADPLFDLAALQQARGRFRDAEAALERAVRLQPADAETWRRLGRLELSVLHKPDAALKDFRAAYYLDPHSAQSVSDVIEATRAAGG
jgi:cytochrome c-type biogenesis protein CcmH/NrfG